MEVVKHDREESQAIGTKEEVLNCHALRKHLANDTRSLLQSLQLLISRKGTVYNTTKSI